MTEHQPLPGQRANAQPAFTANGYYFHRVAVVTLIIGMYVHVSRLFLGDDLLLAYVFTPAYDMVLAVPMTYAAVLGWMHLRKVDVHGRRKVLLVAGLTYFTISIPLHIYTYISQSTEYTTIFPLWYSAFILAPMLALCFLFGTLRFRDAGRNTDDE